jgi:hypothetical protein
MECLRRNVEASGIAGKPVVQSTDHTNKSHNTEQNCDHDDSSITRDFEMESVIAINPSYTRRRRKERNQVRIAANKKGTAKTQKYQQEGSRLSERRRQKINTKHR